MSVLERELRLYGFMRPMFDKMAAEVPEDQFHLLPEGGGNSPLWIAGHLAVVQDIGCSLAGAAPQLPKEWGAKYGPGSTPTDDLSVLENKQTLLESFQNTSEAMQSAILALPDDALLAKQQSPFFQEQLPTVADLLGHLLTTHFSLHIGQLSAWRRTRGMQSILQIPAPR